MKHKFISILALLVLIAAALACGKSSPTPLPTEAPPPTNTPRPTATPAPTREPAAAEPIRQWASSAVASSEYGDPDWAAVQAVGEPDTDECGDYPTAWASSSSGTVEWLEVYFDVPVYATEINIIQTYNPDQVVEVELIDADGEYVSVYEQEPVAVDEPCPYTLNLVGDPTEYLVQGVRITIDQSVLGLGWNEIDAVEIVGVPGEGQVQRPQPQPTEEVAPVEFVLWRAGGESGYEEGQFNSITGMDIGPDGNLYVADNLSRIVVVSSDGEYLGTIEADGLWNVSDIKVGEDGLIYAADWGSDDASIYVFSTDGDLLRSWGSKGTGDGEFADFSPDGLAVCNDRVYVADTNEDANGEEYERIQVFDTRGNYLFQWNVSEVAEIYSISGMDCGPDGNIYLVGFIGDYLLVFDGDGNFIGKLGEEALDFSAPNGLAIGSEGNFYVGTWNEGLLVLDPGGNMVASWGENVDEEGPRVEGQLYFAEGVAVEEEGVVYLGDWGGQYSYISKFLIQ